MAAIKKEDLEHLSDKDIWDWMHLEDLSNSKQPMLNYISIGKADNTLGHRINRVETLLMQIITERFMKSEPDDITLHPELEFFNNSGELANVKSIKWISRINNDGMSFIPCTRYNPAISNFERKIGKKIKITLHCLSITHKRWIATDGMSTYIVEIEK